ncbi:CLUMA_CG016001, isoform A [Clunio marinus]|uniref:CLUMA_CG016001, isoform A n=1 Tax=Clunio marinus TaxID=568069 RepID=A0A1J1IT35_9DIPT|nr:CLUMA_CG016001, isoform A [Clunio marinus]
MLNGSEIDDKWYANKHQSCERNVDLRKKKSRNHGGRSLDSLQNLRFIFLFDCLLKFHKS